MPIRKNKKVAFKGLEIRMEWKFSIESQEAEIQCGINFKILKKILMKFSPNMKCEGRIKIFQTCSSKLLSIKYFISETCCRIFSKINKFRKEYLGSRKWRVQKRKSIPGRKPETIQTGAGGSWGHIYRKSVTHQISDVFEYVKRSAEFGNNK